MTLKKQNIIKGIGVISSIVFLVLFFIMKYSGIHAEEDGTQIGKNIAQLESRIKDQNLSLEEIEEINNYLITMSPDSQYYFIKGYLEYINSNYKAAIHNLNLALDSMGDSESAFLRIYTYILLNESLQMEHQYNQLVENSKKVLGYIAEENVYKNDIMLLWRAISVLLNNEEQIQDSISILKSYLNETKGLTDESVARLTANIGQLYTLTHGYSDAIYYYLDTINFINAHPSIPNGDHYKIKLLTSIGDIAFILNEYQSSIECYDQALNTNLQDNEQNALSKSLTFINKCQAYIELGKYNQAISLSNELKGLLSYLEPEIKDDIEILMYNIIALANVQLHNLDEAEIYLLKALELLEKDKIEYSLNKEVFIALTYAQFYKEKKSYDEALKAYDYVLTESINKGLSLEEKVYQQISEIYKEKKDINQYIKYNELFLKEKNDNTQIFKEDYIEYITNLYESDLLKIEAERYKINYLMMLFSLITLAIIILVKTRSVKRLRQLSFTDSMTDLYNRKYLDYYMTKNKKKLLSRKLSVIILDIDYFKKYNDNYGHIEGDRVITEVANILKESVRKGDIVVRYGGEEMILILPDVSQDNVELIAQEIQVNLKNKNIEHKYSEVSNQLTISIGIYTTLFVGQNIYNLINKADTALYRAKNSGRNRYEITSD